MSDEKRKRISAVFDPNHFMEVGNTFLSELNTYLKNSQNASSALMKTLDVKAMPQEAGNFLDNAPVKAEVLTEWFLAHSRLLHSPHYMGHQVPAPIPTSSLFTLMSAMSNQGGAVFEMGPSLAAIERAVIKRMGECVGWKDAFDGIVTNGGTLANLTALLAARNTHLKSSWKKGLKSEKEFTPVILTSADSHYSIARAAGIIGIGTENVIKIPINEKHQVTEDALLKVIEQCKKNNQQIICIAASSCTTATGSYDDLVAIGKICSTEKIWFHVDGAHGASVLFSKKHKHLVKGIEQADSITWDAHKMLFVHSLSTILLYKNAVKSFETFQQDAPYLFSGEKIDDAAYLDAGLRTLECTRQPLAVPLWGVWSMYGPELFEDLIDTTFENAQTFYNLLKENSDFVALHEPQANIQCFRYIPDKLKAASAKEISNLQVKVKEQLLKSGKFYITSTMIDGMTALRVTLMNPLIDKPHLMELLKTISSYGPATTAQSNN